MSFRGSLRKIENKKKPQLAASWTAKPKITDEKKTDSIADDILCWGMVFGGIKGEWQRFDTSCDIPLRIEAISNQFRSSSL